MEYLYTLNDKNLHIVDSYSIPKKEFNDILVHIAHKNYTNVIFYNRSIHSMKMEWAVHNFLYKIGFKRERTKDVDINYPCDKPTWIYNILGLLCWIFIK